MLVAKYTQEELIREFENLVRERLADLKSPKPGRRGWAATMLRPAMLTAGSYHGIDFMFAGISYSTLIEKNPELFREVIEGLVQALGDSVREVQNDAAGTLSDIAREFGARHVIPALVNGLRDKNGAVVTNSLYMLGKIGWLKEKTDDDRKLEMEAAGLLLKLYETQEQEYIDSALKGIDPAITVPMLAEALKEEKTRWQALESLSKLEMEWSARPELADQAVKAAADLFSLRETYEGYSRHAENTISFIERLGPSAVAYGMGRALQVAERYGAFDTLNYAIHTLGELKEDDWAKIEPKAIDSALTGLMKSYRFGCYSQSYHIEREFTAVEDKILKNSGPEAFIPPLLRGMGDADERFSEHAIWVLNRVDWQKAWQLQPELVGRAATELNAAGERYKSDEFTHNRIASMLEKIGQAQKGPGEPAAQKKIGLK